MKEPAPHILRKGSVVRVAGAQEGGAAPAYALAFVDLLFEDGHVERWLGSGSLRDDPADPVPYSDLVAWGAEVAAEHSMIADLGMAFHGVDRQALAEAPVEIVVEWTAELPSAPL